MYYNLVNDAKRWGRFPQGHFDFLCTDFSIRNHVCHDASTEYSLPYSYLFTKCKKSLIEGKCQLSDEDLGTYTGIFTAAFFVGMIPGAVMWGRLSDLFGRKPAMVATLICMNLDSWLIDKAMCFVLWFSAFPQTILLV